MSEKFLISPGPLLNTLSKEMLYRLNHYPMLAIKPEKIEYFCGRFRLLFNGDYRPVRFQTALLHSCIMQYCECILIFVQDNAVSMKKDEADYLKRWLTVLDNLGGVDSIMNKFTFFMPMLQNPVYENLPLWVKKEFMLHLNRIFEKPTQLIFGRKEKKFFLRTVERWLKLIMTCGDYEFQTIIVETIIITCELCHIEEVLVRNFGETNTFTRMFLELYSKQNYVNDLKTFLFAINDSFDQVRSVACLKVTLEETVIPPLKGMNGDFTWMHINYGFSTLSFSCQQDSLRSLPGSVNHSDSYEFVTVNFEDIDKICLLINNDSKTANSVGGIFLIGLTGKCSCRFDSSKEIVSSIKKITVTVPDGSHLQFLKGAFSKLFGKKFKEDTKLPIKKRNFYDKRDSPLSSSTPNSSFRTENRRRMRKPNDSMSSQGSVFLKNVKLENSLSLENKENVTDDCSLNSIDLSFKKPVVVENRAPSNSPLQAAELNIRIVTRNQSATEKVDHQNKIKTEAFKNCGLMSPDTTTNEFMNDKKSNSPDKSSKGRNGKGGRGKKKLSLLKYPDIPTQSTSKNTEMTGATTEDMTIPSNYKFGEDNSLTILEENKSLILDFINDELDSIPDLRSPSRPKNKSGKGKVRKANSPPMSASETISGAKIQAKPLNEESQNDLEKSFTLPLISSKLKKNTKRLPKYGKKDVENRRKLKKEGKTVGRLLRSSVQSINEICKEPSSLCLKNKSRRRVKLPDSIKIDHSYSLANTEVIDNEVVESKCYSIAQDAVPAEESNQMHNYFGTSTLSLGRRNALKQLIGMNTEEIGNVEVVSKIETPTVDPNSVFPFDYATDKQQDDVTLAQQESEYYSCNPDITSTADNKVSSGILEELSFNLGNNESVGKRNRRISKASSSKGCSQKSEENKNFSNVESDRLNDNSETPDIDLILARSARNIVYSTDENTTELINEDHSYASKHIEEVIEINDDEEMSVDDVHLSTETVKINNESSPRNIPEQIEAFAEGQTRDDDNTIISISSIEDIDPDVSTENMLDLQTGSLVDEQIENKQYDDVRDAQEFLILKIKNVQDDRTDDHIDIVSTSSTGTKLDNQATEKNKQYDVAQKMQMLEVRDIEDVSEKPKDADDHIIFISTSSTEGRSSGEKLDNQPTGKNKQFSAKHEDVDDQVIISIYPENVKNKPTDHNIPSEHNYSSPEKTENAGAEKIKILEINDIIINDHCYSSNQAPMAIDTKNGEDHSVKFADVENINDIITNDHCYSSNRPPMAIDTKSGEDHSVKFADVENINDMITNDHCYSSNRPPMAIDTKSGEDHSVEFASNESNRSAGSVDGISPTKELPLPTASRISSDEQQGNKIKILSNIRIVSPHKSRISPSHLNEKYAVVSNDLQNCKDEITRLYAELAFKTQKIEQLEQINKETVEVIHSEPKKKRTKEHIASRANSNENEIFEKSNEETLGGWLIKEFLRNEPNVSQTPNGNSDFEMLTAGNEFNSQKLTQSPIMAANEKKHVTPSIDKFKKSPLNKSAPKIEVRTEFSLTTTPKKRLSDKSTLGGELAQKIRKSEVCNLEMMETENGVETKKLTDVWSTPKAHESKKVNEDFNFIQVFESIPNTLEPLKVRKFVKEVKAGRKQKSKENGFEKLVTKPSTASGNKMDNGGLYNLIGKPHKSYEKSDRSGEALKVGQGSRNKVRHDENHYHAVDEIYGFDAMLDAYSCFLKTCKTPAGKNKKHQKKKIGKIKLRTLKKAKSKSEKRKYAKLFSMFKV